MTAREATLYLQQYYRCDNKVQLSAVQDFLGDYSHAFLDLLIKRVIRKCKWMPAVSELAEISREMPHPGAPALPEPELTEAERAQMIANLNKLLLDLLTGKIVRLEQDNLVLKADINRAHEEQRATVEADVLGEGGA